jgi:hypothetical protein
MHVLQGPNARRGPFFRPGEIEFFLRLHGLWQSVVDIPPPPDPPFDIETFEPVEPPWQAIRRGGGREPLGVGGRASRPFEVLREDGYILVLD